MTPRVSLGPVATGQNHLDVPMKDVSLDLLLDQTRQSYSALEGEAVAPSGIFVADDPKSAKTGASLKPTVKALTADEFISGETKPKLKSDVKWNAKLVLPGSEEPRAQDAISRMATRLGYPMPLAKEVALPVLDTTSKTPRLKTVPATIVAKHVHDDSGVLLNELPVSKWPNTVVGAVMLQDMVRNIFGATDGNAFQYRLETGLDGPASVGAASHDLDSGLVKRRMVLAEPNGHLALDASLQARSAFYRFSQATFPLYKAFWEGQRAELPFQVWTEAAARFQAAPEATVASFEQDILASHMFDAGPSGGFANAHEAAEAVFACLQKVGPEYARIQTTLEALRDEYAGLVKAKGQFRGARAFYRNHPDLRKSRAPFWRGDFIVDHMRPLVTKAVSHLTWHNLEKQNGIRVLSAEELAKLPAAERRRLVDTLPAPGGD